MDAKSPEFCAILERLNALEKMGVEREDRNKERFVSFDRNISLAIASADKAVSKAEVATERRFDSVNEFRKTLADQAALLMPRAEYHAQHIALEDVVAKIERRLANIETSYANLQGKIWAVSAIWGILVLIASIGVKFIH